MVFFSCKRFIKRQENHFIEKVLVSLAISFYSLQSSILSALVELSVCQEFDFGSYLTVYLTENCNSERYLNFYHFMVFPMLLMFSTILPFLALAYIVIKHKKGQTQQKGVFRKIGFFIIGYNPKKYYW